MRGSTRWTTRFSDELDMNCTNVIVNCHIVNCTILLHSYGELSCKRYLVCVTKTNCSNRSYIRTPVWIEVSFDPVHLTGPPLPIILFNIIDGLLHKMFIIVEIGGVLWDIFTTIMRVQIYDFVCRVLSHLLRW